MSWLHRISPCIRETTEAMPPATGQSPAGSHYIQPPRVIYDHELVLYLGSEFAVEIGGERLTAQPGSYVIFPPGRLHSEANIGQRPGHRYWCHFDWTWQGPYGETPLMTHHPTPPRPQFYRRTPNWVPPGILHGPLPDSDRTTVLAGRLDRLWRLGNATERLATRGVLLQLLLLLLGPERGADRPPPAANPLAVRVRDRLNDIAAEPGPPCLTDRFRDLGYSYEHLSRVFRREFGIPPSQYVQAQRLGRARLLLSDPERTVAEVAAAVGFVNASHFARVFRDHTGRTPTQWRRHQSPDR